MPCLSQRPKPNLQPAKTLSTNHGIKLSPIQPMIPRLTRLHARKHEPNDLQHLSRHSHNSLLTTSPTLHPFTETPHPPVKPDSNPSTLNQSPPNFNQELLKEFADISIRSGGGIKFDLKFWNSNLNKAITGVDNKNSYECFRMLGDLHRERRKVPFLRASTLLVP